ncbi:MAG: pyridoxal 5'-phosphate synthase, partial [Solirubrobacterales bacterium]
HGEVTEAPEADSDAYFASRARESQIGAWASEQGTVIPDRASLEERVAYFTEKFEGESVPRPPHWGGYIVAPYAIEFWQAGDFRLHDRFVYAREGDGWTVERLSP